MKTLIKQFRLTSTVLLILLLFQSCTVYKSPNITLKEAENAQSVVRAKTIDKKTYKYYRIGFENDYFYGLNYKNGEEIKIRLNEDKIQKVQAKSIEGSVLATIVVPTVSVIIVGAALLLSDPDNR